MQIKCKKNFSLYAIYKKNSETFSSLTTHLHYLLNSIFIFYGTEYFFNGKHMYSGHTR